MLSSYFIVPLAGSILYLSLLAVTLAANYRSRVNRTLALSLLCMLTWSFASFAGRLRLFAGDPMLWARILAAGCMGLPITFYHFVREYVGIQTPDRRLHAGYALYAFFVLLAFFTNWIVSSARLVEFKFYVQQGPLAYALVLPWGAAFFWLAVQALQQRYHDTRDPDLRSKIRYILIGAAYSVVGGMATQLPALRVFPLDIAGSVVNALILTYCILRYRLFDVSPALRQLLTYLVLIAVVGGGYVLNFLVLRRWIIQQGVWVLWLVAGLVVLLTLFFPPLRRFAQTVVNRLVFPQQYEMQRLLLRLATTTGTIMDPQALTELIVEEVTASMKIERAGIFLQAVDTGDFQLVTAKGLPGSVPQMRWRPDHPVVVALAGAHKPLLRADIDEQMQAYAVQNPDADLVQRFEPQLFVPMHTEDKLVGVFIAGPKLSLLNYTADERQELETIASQTVVAVENARLRGAEQQRLDESLLLLDIAQASGSTLLLTPLLKLIAQRTAEACGAHRCSIFLLDEQEQRILPLMSQYASGTSDDKLWEQFRRGTYVQRLNEVPALQPMLRDRLPLLLGEREIAALPRDWIAPFAVRSLLLVPLLARNRVTGAMALDQIEPGKRFGREQINLAMTIGSQAAAAIENARLFEQLQVRAQRLALLYQISLAVTATLNLSEILRTTVTGLPQAFGVSQCGVVLFDEEHKSGRLLAEYPQRSGTNIVTIPVRGNLSAERIMVTKRPLAIEDAQHDPMLASIRELMVQRGVKSILLVPLLLRDEVVGTIGLDATDEKRVFTDEEMELAQTVANQISIAIENARLYQQTIQGKAELEVILEQTFSGLLVVDHGLRVVSLNAGAEQLTGYSAGETLGKRLSDVFGAELAGPGSPLLKAIETGEKVPPVETTLPVHGGTKDILLGVTPLPNTGQLGGRYLLSIMDITKLKEIDRLKSSIVANVSHELRTPLASIKVYTELLLGSVPETDQYREWLEVIDRETDRLTSLINDFLDLSRLESGRLTLRREPLQLEQLVSEVVGMLQVQAQRRGIQIAVEAEPGLGTLQADRDLMRIVVKNLVGNAVKFSHDDSSVRVKVWQDERGIRFSVTDDGIGIPRDAIPHLFTKFFRVASGSPSEVQGTGLGLALAREAVLAHGGQIDVESTLGKGSCFTVTVPNVSQPQLDKIVT